MPQPDIQNSDFARSFKAGLLDPEMAVPAEVSGPEGGAATRRYAVYRNNVSHSLVVALGDIFPAVKALAGGEFFHALALTFLRRDPPRTKLLFEYGRSFPDFLEAFAPAAAFPHLADVARAERAWLDAFHAADAEPLDGARLAAVEPDKLGGLRFIMHPAFRLIRSPHAVVTLVSGARAGDDPQTIPSAGAEDAMITRRHLDVEMRRLPPGAAAFFSALANGETLGEAAGIALAEAADFDLSAALAAALQAGAFAAIDLPGEEE